MKVAALGALAVAACAAIYLAYRADAARAEAEVIAGGSRIAATACGPVEYLDIGSGPVLLLVHGAGGGFDQASELAEALARDGNRVIAMSRFGYLRTPLPADASPEAQADAHACLLDALGIERATIAGISAGAPSSLHFALRHAHRIDGLALLVPLAYRPGFDPEPSSAIAAFMYRHAVRSGFLYWAMLRAAPTLVQRTILATPPEVIATASADERARVDRLMERIMPLDVREQGLVNDALVAAALKPLPLERIEALTLIISLRDDLYGTYESARYLASRIPGARFVDYEEGGHVWVGHHAQVVEELRLFMRATPWDLLARL